MTGLRSILPPPRSRSRHAGGAALGLVLALVPAGVGAQAAYPHVSAREVYRDRVLIGSDGTLVGLQAEGADESIDRDELIVHLPRTDADSLCVSIRSIDGRYEGDFQFAARRMQRGPVLLDVRSPRYARERDAYAPERLAVHASLAGSCSGDTGTMVVVGRTRALPAALRLSLNADAGMVVRAEVGSGSPPAAARCPVVREPNPYAYNRACTVPLPRPSGPHPLRLFLRVPGQDARRITYVVEVP
jgi:hypothetical protein